MQAERTRPRGREEYKAYLKSPHWQVTRRRALIRAGHRCQVCNEPGLLDVHHRTYERLGAELPGDLTVLCRKCHDLFHGAQTRRKTTKRREVADALVDSALARQALQLLAEHGSGTTHMLMDWSGAYRHQVEPCMQALQKAGLVRKQKKRWHVARDGWVVLTGSPDGGLGEFLSGTVKRAA